MTFYSILLGCQSLDQKTCLETRHWKTKWHTQTTRSCNLQNMETWVLKFKLPNMNVLPLLWFEFYFLFNFWFQYGINFIDNSSFLKMYIVYSKHILSCSCTFLALGIEILKNSGLNIEVQISFHMVIFDLDCWFSCNAIVDSNIAFLAQHLGTISPDFLTEQIDKPSWSQWYYAGWHQVKVAGSNKTVVDCLCFPKNWKSRKSGYLISQGIYIFPWTKQQLFKERSKKLWNMKIKSHQQTKLKRKRKSMCAGV